MARKVIIDTDPGLDDALALCLALRSPELDVLAVTTVAGNVDAARCFENARRIVGICQGERAPAVSRGCARPLRREPVDAAHVHGHDGLGGVDAPANRSGRPPDARPAADRIAETAAAWPGEVTLIALGPLTNIATAWRRAPETMRALQEIIVMGGSLCGIGNATPVAEFNFYADPHAASELLASGLPVTLVGLDVTEKALLRREDFEAALAGRGDHYSQFVRDIGRAYFRLDRVEQPREACKLHDPLAVAVAIDPTLVRTERFEAGVETEGRLTRGMLVADRRAGKRPAGPISVGVDLDAPRFLEMFLSRL